ncbi:MAG: hypothetical protein E7Z88_03480 [Cyanobacteria bacterium SIG27]|nr:hypothetical protein [Cyanobacteria bacterium SIG27]MBQ9150083.1 hypothetical protein [bacterium]
MSFDFGPMQNLSNVQASAKSCAGGGGNTGYFKRGQASEEEADIGFSKDYPEDSFEYEGSLDEIQKQSFIDIIKNLFLDFIEMIKGFFAK